MSVKPCENRTKQQLDNALRQLLTQKTVGQIRIRELTDLCVIRRQSFYYHFPDVYALFDWSLQRERAHLLERQERYLTWQQALMDLLDHIRRHRCYYQALLESRGRKGLQEVLNDALIRLMEQTRDYYRYRCGISPDMTANNINSAEALLLVLLESWIQEELLQPPEDIVALMETLVQQSVIGAAWQNVFHQTQL